MCLFTDLHEPLTAKTDMLVFKVLVNRLYGMKFDPVITIFTRQRVPADGILKAEGVVTPVYYEKQKLYSIAQGMVHAYTDYPIAIVNMRDHSNWMCTQINKAYIPKGTLYYTGIDGDICSEVLHIDLSHCIDRKSTQEEIDNFYRPITCMPLLYTSTDSLKL